MNNPRFDWDPELQGIILGSFYALYMFIQIPAGRWSEKIGGKWIVGFSIIGSGIINIVTPFAASSSGILLIVTRVILGMVQVNEQICNCEFNKF